MKIVLVVVLLRIYGTDSRVFCQDAHASLWTPLGFSCPLNCGNIVTAVKKIKMLDYQLLFKNKFRYVNNSSSEETSLEMLNTNSIFEDTRRNSISNIHKIHKIMRDKKFLTGFRFALKMAVNLTNCLQNGAKSLNCRRSYEPDDFVKKFTILLNKYTSHEYQFTEDMTSIILEKILGANLDLRHGLIDVKRIIAFLSKAILYHRTHVMEGSVIKLKSRHCLTIAVAGCYCKTGLVENSGQCVRPTDCVQKQDAEYLDRIVLL